MVVSARRSHLLLPEFFWHPEIFSGGAMNTIPAERSNREFWLAHVKAWRASGLKKQDYCDANDLKVSAMSYWCRIDVEPKSVTPLTLIPLNQSSVRGNIAVTVNWLALLRVV